MLKSSPDMDQLREVLAPLGRYRFFISAGRVARRLFEFYFVLVVVSFFVGFLEMFSLSMDGDGGLFFLILRGFMLSVLGLVLFAIIRKQLKLLLAERNSLLADSGVLINILTLVLTVVGYYVGFILGTRYLGTDMGMGFMFRWIGGIGSIFVLLIPYYFLKRIESSYILRYKNALISTMLPALSVEANYSPDSYISQEIFTQSDLFPSGQIIRYTGSDLMVRDRAHYQCSNLSVMHKIEKHSIGKTEIKYEQLFAGYFIVMDFNKAFHGSTFLFPDEANDVAGSVYGEMLNRLGARAGTTLALMEDPQFEKHFSVYTTDQQEARYILSPKLIERINDMRSAFSQDVAFSFTGNRMYVAISCTEDLFSPPLFGPVFDPVLVEKQVHRLTVMATLPELFDLDRHIWGA